MNADAPRADSTLVPAHRAEPAHGPAWPENPVLARVWRGDWIESQHRGAWVLADAAGRALEGAGDCEHPIFARSSIKALQALPLLETGAAERFHFSDEEIALAVASHDGEPCHTDRVAALLDRLGLTADQLLCGAQPPGSSRARAALARDGRKPTALHNNCSGKHAGFLALALHLGVDPARYLDPESASQRLVRQAIGEMSLCRPGELTQALDGCSAPTFRLPLGRLAAGLARVANPDLLEEPRREACRRILRAVAAWPELIAGTHQRLCTDLVRASGGRLFAKIGGDAVYAIGVRGAGRGLAVKIDDGAQRGLDALVLALCRRFGFLSEEELQGLEAWRGASLRNWAGREIGRVEVVA